MQHFGLEHDFEVQNVESVQRVAEFCLSGKTKKLVHISTMSVIDGCIHSDFGFFNETCVDLDENLASNLYVKSKIRAEKVIFESGKKLEWQIIRLGNVCFDSEEIILQRNRTTNAFLSRLTAFIRMKKIPKGIIVNEYGYVNEMARAVRILASVWSSKNAVYHLYNQNLDFFENVVAHDQSIDVIPIDEYLYQIETHIVNDFESIRDLVLHLDIDAFLKPQQSVQPDNCHTDSVLGSFDFSWTPMDSEIGIKFLDRLNISN